MTPRSAVFGNAVARRPGINREYHLSVACRLSRELKPAPRKTKCAKFRACENANRRRLLKSNCRDDAGGRYAEPCIRFCIIQKCDNMLIAEFSHGLPPRTPPRKSFASACNVFEFSGDARVPAALPTERRETANHCLPRTRYIAANSINAVLTRLVFCWSTVKFRSVPRHRNCSLGPARNRDAIVADGDARPQGGLTTTAMADGTRRRRETVAAVARVSAGARATRRTTTAR